MNKKLKGRVWPMLVVMLLLSLGLIACGDSTTTSPATTSAVTTLAATSAAPIANTTASATTSVAANSSAVSFPRTVVDGAGRSVTIPKKPERIAALTFDTAEVVLQTVEVSRVIAVVKNAQDPTITYAADKAKLVPNITGQTQPDPEQVVALKPDLIVITLTHTGEQDFAKLIDQAGIPLIKIDNWDSVEQVKKNITILTQAVGEDAKGQALIADIDKRIGAVKEKVAGAKNKVRALAVNPIANGLTPGPGALLHEMIGLAGGINAAEELGIKKWSPIDVEKIVKANPDVLFISDLIAQNPNFNNDLLAQPAMAKIKAKQDNRIYTLSSKDTFGAYFYIGVEQLAKQMYPDSFK